MAGTSPRLPEQFRQGGGHAPEDFLVSELMSEAAGAHSPFGDTEFPLPVEALHYKHPGPGERPKFADGR